MARKLTNFCVRGLSLLQEMNVQLSMRRKRSWRVALAGILRPSSASQAAGAQRALPSQQEDAYPLPSQRSV
jgi:hypothetical protein